MKEKPNYLFNGVCVASGDEVHVSSSIQQLNEDRIDNMVIHHFRNDQWLSPSSAIWACAGMCSLSENEGEVLCVATAGEVFVFPRMGDVEEFTETQGEHVDRSDDGPSDLVHLKCVERIGATIYCAGFARRVYRRDPGGRRWTPTDRGTFVPRGQRTGAIGFLGMAGRSEEEFYAVGLDGEIWSCFGGEWKAEPSPTNVALNTISILPDGFACIGGMVGVVICGRTGNWQVVQQDVTREAFWGSTVFHGRVYMANNEGVFALSNNYDELEQVYAGPSIGAATSYLDSSDDVMWSVGDHAMARTDDGFNWSEVGAPVE